MNKLISIVVPAYNRPQLLDRALKSLISQTYRPLEIIVSDDFSPEPLMKVCEKYNNRPISDVCIKYIRNPSNLSFYWNLISSIKYASGDYLMQFHHDDYTINENFLLESIKQFEDATVTVAISNSLVEGELMKMMAWDYDGWLKIDGINFLERYMYSNAHPSYSAIILRKNCLTETNYQKNYISKEEAESFSSELDEALLMTIILACRGYVAVNGFAYTVRGMPLESYSRGILWKNKGGSLAGFAVLYHYLKTGANYKERRVLKNILRKIYCNSPKLNIRYIIFCKKKYGEIKEVTLFMVLSVLVHYFNHVLNIKSEMKIFFRKISEKFFNFS